MLMPMAAFESIDMDIMFFCSAVISPPVLHGREGVVPCGIELGDDHAFRGGGGEQFLDAIGGHVPHFRLRHGQRLTCGLAGQFTQRLVVLAVGWRKFGHDEADTDLCVVGERGISQRRARECEHGNSKQCYDISSTTFEGTSRNVNKMAINSGCTAITRWTPWPRFQGARSSL